MTSTFAEELDVLIVGAGISGIGAAWYLKTEHPTKTFAVLEARADVGGTWDLHRYPGIRSDSDLYTFGFEFKPWRDKETIATGERILAYLKETVEENNLGSYIRFNHKVLRANWSSSASRWLVEVEHQTRKGTETKVLSVGWLFSAGGYYNYEKGFTPDFTGMDRFSGQIIHPQHWPEDLDYSGKKVVVIGSGATAITMVPAMAGTAAHVTMLQRTPTYIMPFPSQDKLANLIKRVLPADRAHRIIRNRYVFQQRLFWKFCQRYPNASRRFINWTQRQALPDGYPIDPNFNPPYQPWDQRLCVVPDGDLFKAISEGTATIVTDHVESFTETGIKLQSGKHLDADIVVTATGFNIQIAGGIELSLDGEAVDFTDRVIYRGTMLSGIPNFSVSIGYTNASWTLKVGILCEYFVKLLRHMDNNGYTAAWAVADPDMPTRPLLDFGAGYVQRALTNLPKQGPDAPWLMSRDYLDDRRLLRKGQIVDEFLHFSTSKHAEAPVGESVA